MENCGQLWKKYKITHIIAMKYQVLITQFCFLLPNDWFLDCKLSFLHIHDVYLSTSDKLIKKELSWRSDKIITYYQKNATYLIQTLHSAPCRWSWWQRLLRQALFHQGALLYTTQWFLHLAGRCGNLDDNVTRCIYTNIRSKNNIR